jgi:putative PIN family toxin of toxin-antitoxin system
MKLLLDTDVVVAGMRSPTGASAELLRRARRNEFILCASVPLFIEYEATCSRAEHKTAAGLSDFEADIFLDVLATLIEPVNIHYLWRPQLRDPADEMVLEAAVNGQVDWLVTFNTRDFGHTPAKFGLLIANPSTVLRSLK